MALPAERPPVRIEEGAEHSFRCGLAGSYKPGDLPVTRWFAWDATGRKYPLRERYRQRIEHVIWGTPPQRLD